MPYSTYSLSASLVAAVHGWDPDWISEDWHMALKCFFATAGRLRVTPIFLPVMNYAVEGLSLYETFVARWKQAKRHALGFCEVCYFLEQFPRVFRTIPDTRARIVFLWRGTLLYLKLVMLHLFVGSYWSIGLINGLLIAWFVRNEQPGDLNINSWTFLVNCICQLVSLLSVHLVFCMSVVIFEATKERIDGANNPAMSIFWRSKFLHVVSCVLQSYLALPVFFACTCGSEWIAAIKAIRTHKFDYEVAAKPVLHSSAEATRGP